MRNLFFPTAQNFCISSRRPRAAAAPAGLSSTLSVRNLFFPTAQNFCISSRRPRAAAAPAGLSSRSRCATCSFLQPKIFAFLAGGLALQPRPPGCPRRSRCATCYPLAYVGSFVAFLAGGLTRQRHARRAVLSRTLGTLSVGVHTELAHPLPQQKTICSAALRGKASARNCIARPKKCSSGVERRSRLLVESLTICSVWRNRRKRSSRWRAAPRRPRVSLMTCWRTLTRRPRRPG